LPWPELPAHAPLAANELRLCWCPERSEPGPRRQRVDRLLRAALAPALGLPAEALAFGRESKGRPFLRHQGAPDFNLSDTRGGTLVALCAGGRIGVDLERIDRQLPVLRLAARWFSRQECQVLQGLPAEQARSAFLRLWTAKEASCKATGTGIFGYLDRWRFDPLSDAPSLQLPPDDAGAAPRWSFLRLSPSPEHTAVLALRDAPALSISVYQLTA
jgi:4'-phosphopantetheinyl transferase